MSGRSCRETRRYERFKRGMRKRYWQPPSDRKQEVVELNLRGHDSQVYAPE